MASYKDLRERRIPLYTLYSVYRIASLLLVTLMLAGCCGDSALAIRNPLVQMTVPTPVPTMWGIQGPPQMMQMQYVPQAPQYAAQPCAPAAPAPSFAPTYAPPPVAAPQNPCPEPIAFTDNDPL